MEAERALVCRVVRINDSDDEKPTRGKARSWIKGRTVSGYFKNIIFELMIEDRMGFKEMFQMSVEDFEFILKYIARWYSFIRKCESIRLVLDKTPFKPIQHENYGMKVYSKTNFHPTYFFVIFII